MEKIFADRCPRCGEIFEYTEEATLLKCEFCQHTFRVAEFMSQRQKLAQQLEAGEVAKQALVETQAEKTKLQERLNNTLTALELIQSSQAHEESALNNVLEVLEEDRQMHDAMAELLRAMRSEQATGQDALSQLLCTMMQEQSSVEGKLNEVQALVTRILDAQLSGAAAERKMRREIQDEIDQLKINEELKGKLAEDFYDWSREMHEGDLQRLKALQSSSLELLAGQHAITERLMHMDSAISKMSTTVTKGFDTLYQQRLEKLKELYHQATGFQVARDFDKAEEKYLNLLVEGGEDAKDAEVYWRLLLCHYGIEYQKDEEKLIPIILRPDLSPMESLDAYQNLKRYIKTDDQRKFYHAQLETINFYLQRYREVKQNPEWQYDVFISVKQSYGNQPTKDSVEAMKVYHRLVSTDPELAKRKLKVFNSAITKPPANEPYEPYIITALMSAKVLIVVGSCNEFMNSQWVKNEWSRFQYLQEADIKKTNHTARKLLCYLIGGMSTYDIPREMKDRQAIVADADAGDHLRAVIETAFPTDTSKPTIPPVPPPTQPTPMPHNKKWWIGLFVAVILLAVGIGYILPHATDDPVTATASPTVKAPPTARPTSPPTPTPTLTPTPTPTSPPVPIGGIVRFGKYEQDGNSNNGPEPIEWFILDYDDQGALLISRYSLDAVQFHRANTAVNWETCTLRTWLNNDFLTTAFSPNELEHVVDSRISPHSDTGSAFETVLDSGNATIDKVFLLSAYELNTSFMYRSVFYDGTIPLRAPMTIYASAKAPDHHDCWWLRGAVYDKQSDYPYSVSTVGNSPGTFAVVPITWKNVGVRPMIRIDSIEALINE